MSTSLCSILDTEYLLAARNECQRLSARNDKVKLRAERLIMYVICLFVFSRTCPLPVSWPTYWQGASSRKYKSLRKAADGLVVGGPTTFSMLMIINDL